MPPCTCDHVDCPECGPRIANRVMPSPHSPKVEPACPECARPLQKVRKASSSPLNDEQFDAVRAGDWFCEHHTNGRGNTSYAYYWNREVTIPGGEVPTILSCADYTAPSESQYASWAGGKSYSAPAAPKVEREMEPSPTNKPAIWQLRGRKKR
jgi:hypothetical protein